MKKAFLALVIGMFCLAGGAFYVYRDILAYARLPAAPGSEGVVIDVPAGRGFRAMAAQLAAAGVVKAPVKFRLYARIKGYDRRVKAGEYLLSAAMSPEQTLQLLINGKVLLHKVTVPEGYTLKQIAAVLSGSQLIEEGAFLEAAANRNLMDALGIPAESFEGYLFPDTYHFPRDIRPEKVISTMVGRFWEQFKPEWKERTERLAFSIHELITLASLIEKETGIPAERSLVSSVFHNRLQQGMRLESDPTVIYGLDPFDGNLTREHLNTPAPYNTYRIRGLPPGPIANPGTAAIEAALFPADTPFLFFVARQDGTHQFSETLIEHNRAVRKYQSGNKRGR